MDPRTEIREFLASRRARLTPEQVGLPTHGGIRRVKGLRREEVALLAGVSPDYYIRLERGGLSGASPAVIEALARALRLDEAERSHLFDLARAGRDVPAGRQPRSRSRRQVRPGVQRMLDGILAPALVRNARADVLAGNQVGNALYAPIFDDPPGRRTRPGSPFSTRAPATSTRRGNRRPTTSPPGSAPRPAGTRSTAA